MSNIPLKYDPRPGQKTIRDTFAESVNQDKKFIYYDAPVGVGKSFSGVLMADWYKNNVNNKAKVDILTNTKILQEQYTDDFAFMNNLWGKSNYYCSKFETDCATSQQIQEVKKEKCNKCRYKAARANFLEGDVGLTNFHLYSSYAIYSPDMLDKRKSNLLIVDEAHLFENIICDFLSTFISVESFKKLDIFHNNQVRSAIGSINSLKKAYDFCYEVLIPVLSDKIKTYEAKLTNEDLPKNREIDLARQQSITDRYMCKVNRFVNDYYQNTENWIITTSQDQEGEPTHSIEPVWANIYLRDFIWKRYDHIVFMTGTILDKNLFSYLMGIEPESANYYEINSPFPIKNRKVSYEPVGSMSYKNKRETFPKMVDKIEELSKRHSDSKGIIHTGNYENAFKLKEEFGHDRRFLFSTTNTRDAALEEHENSDRPTILVSPSMMNGIDLKDDLSRWQVIMKIPYPYMGSEKVKKRMNMNDKWYNWRTISDIVQSYGRSIRSKEDWAKTYILDESFTNTLRYNMDEFPEYFLEALEING